MARAPRKQVPNRNNRELRNKRRQDRLALKNAKINEERLKRRRERRREGLSAEKIAKLEARDNARRTIRERAMARRKKAEVEINIPLDETDQENKNPNFDNESHTREVNREIMIMADKFGDESVVVTHFVDGTAISIAEKAKRRDSNGFEALPYVRWRRENDYVWIGFRKPSSTGTVT